MKLHAGAGNPVVVAEVKVEAAGVAIEPAHVASDTPDPVLANEQNPSRSFGDPLLLSEPGISLSRLADKLRMLVYKLLSRNPAPLRIFVVEELSDGLDLVLLVDRRNFQHHLLGLLRHSDLLT